MEVILQARNIHRNYNHASKALHILEGIDLAVAAGEAVAIVGPSGAGKSTLLHILGALDAPNDGQVLFEGKDVYQMKDAQRAKLRNENIGFIFQFYHLLPEFMAWENVILPTLIKDDRRNIQYLQEKGEALLKQVGLAERMKHKPHQLSGGEQQRVAIARAIANEPKILFCDEPTGNLDSKTGEDIISLLMELNKKNKQTLVIVTHDEAIAKKSDRVIHIRDGQIFKT